MATSAIHFYDELVQRLPDLVMQRFRNLPFENGTLIPTTADLQPGVREVAEDIMTGVGDAILLAPGASDIPLVQVSLTEDRYPVVMAVAAYSMEFQESRAIAYSGKPVNDGRLNFARRAIAERLNRFAAYGEASIGARGLVSNANVSIDNNSFAPSSATFDQFVAFLVDVVLRLGLDSDETTYTTDVLLPTKMHVKSQTVVSADSPNLSVLQAVRDRLRDEQNISSVRFTAVPELSSARLEKYGVHASGTNKDRVVAYNRDPMSVDRQIEQSIAEMMPPEYIQVRGTTRFFPLFSCASATKVRELGSVRYIDVAKVA